MVSYSKEKMVPTEHAKNKNKIIILIRERIHWYAIPWRVCLTKSTQQDSKIKEKRSSWKPASHVTVMFKSWKSRQNISQALAVGSFLDWEVYGLFQMMHRKYFFQDEYYFKAFTSCSGLQNINTTKIVDKCIHDEEIQSCCNKLLYNSELVVDGRQSRIKPKGNYQKSLNASHLSN